MRKTTSILTWVVTGFLSLTFIFAGGAKFFNSPQMVQAFAAIGLGQWFRYFTGLCEVAGGIGVWLPRWSWLAALDLACVMVGATVANLTVLHQPAAAILTVVLLGLALGLARARRAAAA